MSGTIPLLLPHTITAWTGTMLPLAYTTHAAKKQPILYGSSATRIYCSVTEQTEMFSAKLQVEYTESTNINNMYYARHFSLQDCRQPTLLQSKRCCPCCNAHSC